MTLFVQAFIIMVLGMGLVFVFLFIVIQAIKWASRLIQYKGWDTEDDGQEISGKGSESEMVAAVAAALEE